MLSGWTKSTSIQLYSTTTLTDYQVKFVVYRSVGISSGDNIYIGKNCETDYRDLRFTSTSDTLYSYWIESSDATSATIWVKIPSIAANAYTELVLQYGNGGASTVSSGEATFEFFDDFTTVDSSKWTISGSVTVSGSEITVSGGASSWASIISKTSFSYNYAVRSRLKSAHWGTTTGSEGFGFNAVLCAYFTQTAAAQAQHYAYYSGGWVAKESIPTWSANTYYIAEIARPTSTTYKGTVNDANIVTGSSIPTTTTPVTFELYNNGYSITSDWICVRKYSATEPTKYYPQPLSNWTYKRSHSITSATTLTNYQVKIRVYRTEGTSTGDTVYLGSKCLANYGDIRFVASDNTTELPYWMETNAGTYADFWVKVDSITSDSSIWIYYGNSSASTTSNGDDTFEFFDDFIGTSLDTSKWSSSLIYYNGASGTANISSGNLILTNSATQSGGTSLRSLNPLPTSQVAIRYKTNERSTSASTYAQFRAVLSQASYTNPAVSGGTYHECNVSKIWFLKDGGVGDPYATNTFVTTTPSIVDAQINIVNPRLYLNNTLGCTGTGDPTDPSGNYIALYVHSTSTSATLDWIIVRKTVTYTSEPTHGTWSDEQEVKSYPLRITINPTTGTDPLSVTYNLSISDPLDNFVLNFGDGQTYTGDGITSFTTTHTYTTPGTYTVWAEGYNEFATHIYYELPYAVEVSAPAVVASFTTSQTYNVVQFTNTSTGNPNEFYWIFGDGTSSYEQNPTHVYHTTGTYTVTLHASNQYQYDDNDQEISISNILVVPKAYFKPPKYIAIYPVFPLSVSFTNLSNTDVGCTYLWDFGNGTTSTDKNPTAIYNSLGMYDVSLTITNPLGASVKSYTNAVHLLECPFIIAKEQVVVSDTTHGFPFTVIHEIIEVVDRIIGSIVCRETVKVYNGDDFMVQGHDEYGIGHTRSRHNEYGIHIIRKKFSQFGAKIIKAILTKTNTDCVGIEQIAVCRETVYVNVSTQDDESP